MTGVPEISPADAADRLRSGDAVALDVREPEEWVAGHISGALLVPLGQLVERVDEVDAGRPVVVVCRTGARSAQATAYLGARGVGAENLAGGMQAWHALGLPIEPADGWIA